MCDYHVCDKYEFVNAEVAKMFKKYAFKRVDTKHPRRQVVTCTACDGTGKEGRRKCWGCDGTGKEEQRINWVNADGAWAAEVDGHTVLFQDYGDWFTLRILAGQKGEVQVLPNLGLVDAHVGNPIHASTGTVAGKNQPGCAIPNPTRLPAGSNCYRTHGGPAHPRDHVVLPDNIVEYMTAGL